MAQVVREPAQSLEFTSHYYHQKQNKTKSFILDNRYLSKTEQYLLLFLSVQGLKDSNTSWCFSVQHEDISRNSMTDRLAANSNTKGVLCWILSDPTGRT
jgi:hypothetical protein